MIPKPDPTPGDTAWFTEARFGLFIHWGLYSLAARHEWVKNYERIPDAGYAHYFRHFDPDLYDAALWADAAADAGMKYFVVTTKHHDGFCLWNTRLSDYKAPNTPFGRDALRPMVDAFRGRNMRVGFYHSLLDWHHPDYPVDANHPMRGNAEYIAAAQSRDIARYREYLHGQTRELLTQYGDVDILWYDFSFPAANGLPGKGAADWGSEDLLRLVRSLQPKIIVNDRLEIDQDVKTPEQYQPRAWPMVDGRPVVWEACQTFSGSWGYHRDEESWKSVDQLVKMLGNTVASTGMMVRLSQLEDLGQAKDEHSALAKAFTTARMRETVAMGRSLLGGNGIVTDFEMAKIFADAEAIYSYEGTYEINALVTGRAITGISAIV